MVKNDFLGKIQYFHLFSSLCFSKDKGCPPTTLNSCYGNAFRYSFSILLQIPSNGIFALDGLAVQGIDVQLLLLLMPEENNFL